MRTDIRRIAFAYLRLSNEEAAEGESSSIKNQRMIIQDYCERNEILLVRVFIDDGWSGGNFDRPAFQEMIALLEQGKANIVITKDLSRLGRDMREASYYAEQFSIKGTSQKMEQHERQICGTIRLLSEFLKTRFTWVTLFLESPGKSA